MSKITLDPVGSLIDVTTAQTTINDNFATVETALDNTLSRDGTSPNQMGSTLDMNSNRIINLPNPVGATEPLRLGDISEINGTITINAVPAGGTTGQALEKTSSTDYAVGWSNTVNSVGLVMPSDFTVTNSPVTTTGNLTAAWANTPTGTGSIVRTNSPSLTTPNLGTPSAVTLTNATGLPISTGVSGLATGVSTFLATPNSANLRSAMTDESGTGALIFAGGALGAATATSINGGTVSPGHYSGEPSNGNALAGEVGEYISSSIAIGSAISLTTNVQTNITSISLTAGDWNVWGTIAFNDTGITSTSTIGSVSTTSATLGTPQSGAYFNVPGQLTNPVFPTGLTRIVLSSTTTVYLVAFRAFSAGTSAAYGGIFARRAR